MGCNPASRNKLERKRRSPLYTLNRYEQYAKLRKFGVVHTTYFSSKVREQFFLDRLRIEALARAKVVFRRIFVYAEGIY